MARRPRSGRVSRVHQRGEMLLGVVFAIAIISAIVVTLIRFEDRRQMISTALAEGEVLGQFVIGLRGFMAAAQANPALLPSGAQQGVDWLKSPACGGRPGNPPAGHVPCNFSGGTLGTLYRTRFTRDLATGAIEIRTSFIVPRWGGAEAAGATNRNAILIAERVVAAAKAAQSNPNNGVFFAAFANVAEAANAPHSATSGAPGGNSGRVVLVVTNAPSHDIFLRTDGTNQMLANLNMGGMSISNARDARFGGDVRVDERLQVRAGVTVTQGTGDFRAGVVTTDAFLSDVNRYASQGFYDAEVYTGAGSYAVAKPDCSRAGNNPGIYAALQSTGTPNDWGYVADALYEARVDVTDLGNAWRVEPVLLGTRFDLSRSEADIVMSKNVHTVPTQSARVLVMRRCR